MILPRSGTGNDAQTMPGAFMNFDASLAPQTDTGSPITK
jgi:hypothetical protein